MNLRIFHFFSALAICLSLSSCFEYIEEVTYKTDQAGQVEITVNCSRSKSRLDALMKLDTFMGYRIPNRHTITSELNLAVHALENSKGISQVRQSWDFDNYIFVIKADFDSTSNLNEALNNVSRAVARKNDIPEYDLFAHSGKKFERLIISNDSLIAASDIRRRAGMFEGASATAIYRFPGNVKAVSNKNAIISKNGKAVMLKADIKELIKKPNIFANTITLQ